MRRCPIRPKLFVRLTVGFPYQQAHLDGLLMHITSCTSGIQNLHFNAPLFFLLPSFPLEGGCSDVGVPQQRFSSACSLTKVTFCDWQHCVVPAHARTSLSSWLMRH